LRRIVELLAEHGELPAGTIGREFAMSAPDVSHSEA
jgi:hypothetical protein